MSLNIIVRHLNEDTYERNTVYIGALSAMIASSTIKDVRKQIKEAYGSCPQIVKLYGQNLYAFKHSCKPVHVDYELSYLLPDEDIPINLYRGVGDMHLGNPLYTTEPQPNYEDYNGYGQSLHRWITEGYECEECGTLHIHTRTQAGDLCRSCVEQHQPHNYSTRAEDLLGFEETKERLFGVELEYEGVNALQVKRTLVGHAIAKRDGTIRDGVEVVTRPACIKTHKEKLLAFYKAVKVHSAPNTGMHVHVSKEGLSNFQIGFMLEFMNATHLVKHIEKIAGRQYSENHYCRANANYNMLWGNHVDDRFYKQTRDHTTKYSPLNTSKESTIEFRIFSSPTTHEEYAAKLDFVAALVRYSSPYMVIVKSFKDKFDWDCFIEFIKANRKEFPDFNNHFLKKEA